MSQTNDDAKLNPRQLNVLTSLRTAVKGLQPPVRACGDCTRCCEGWLEGSALGHSFGPGRPCFYLERTCTVYVDRPADPCKNFRCSWLAQDTFPMWTKPNLSNLIITKDIDPLSLAEHYVVDPTGDPDPRAIAWIERWATETGANVEYHLAGERRRQGTPAFVAATPRR